MGHHYMTEQERHKLEFYLQEKKPVSWIAIALGFSRQTIYNEIRRGQVQQIKTVNGIQRDVVEYSADKAQQHHRYNQTAKGRPLKIGSHHNYAQRLEALMLGVQEDGSIDRRRRFSPGAALAQAQKEGYTVTVCRTTLYSYIDKGIFLSLTNKDLWRPRRKRGYRPIQRVVHPKLPSIERRPPEIADRQEYGHWEMDLVLGTTGSKAALLTLAERKSRQVVIIKIPDKTKASVIKAVAGVEAEIKTITTDNGPEFLGYEEMKAALPTLKEIYYCHSYAAWEKGTNEVHNRMIRRWYPKGTNFGQIAQVELDELAEWMNKYPRKVLGWKCPADITT